MKNYTQRSSEDDFEAISHESGSTTPRTTRSISPTLSENRGELVVTMGSTDVIQLSINELIYKVYQAAKEQGLDLSKHTNRKKELNLEIKATHNSPLDEKENMSLQVKQAELIKIMGNPRRARRKVKEAISEVESKVLTQKLDGFQKQLDAEIQRVDMLIRGLVREAEEVGTDDYQDYRTASIQLNKAQQALQKAEKTKIDAESGKAVAEAELDRLMQSPKNEVPKSRLEILQAFTKDKLNEAKKRLDGASDESKQKNEHEQQAIEASKARLTEAEDVLIDALINYKTADRNVAFAQQNADEKYSRLSGVEQLRLAELNGLKNRLSQLQAEPIMQGVALLENDINSAIARQGESRRIESFRKRYEGLMQSEAIGRSILSAGLEKEHASMLEKLGNQMKSAARLKLVEAETKAREELKTEGTSVLEALRNQMEAEALQLQEEEDDEKRIENSLMTIVDDMDDVDLDNVEQVIQALKVYGSSLKEKIGTATKDSVGGVVVAEAEKLNASYQEYKNANENEKEEKLRTFNKALEASYKTFDNHREYKVCRDIISKIIRVVKRLLTGEAEKSSAHIKNSMFNTNRQKYVADISKEIQNKAPDVKG